MIPKILNLTMCSLSNVSTLCFYSLPWWCMHVGYGFALCVAGVSFWVTVEVAGVFGKDKAARWLKSFAISIAESVFLSQPMKVIH